MTAKDLEKELYKIIPNCRCVEVVELAEWLIKHIDRLYEAIKGKENGKS